MADENNTVGDFTDRVVVVTGANSGIGLAAALEFARRGGRVALVGRDPHRLAEAEQAVRAVARPGAGVGAFQADYGVLAQVRALAEALAGAYPRIDVLANNAGLAVPKRATTGDGFEATMQTNHLAPFLLTNLLHDRLVGGRVVNTSSDAHRSGLIDPDDLNSTDRNYRALTVYGSTKAANILFAAEAARRWPDILSTSFHPGVVRTRFGRDSALLSAFYKVSPFLRSPEKGAETLLWLATAPAAEIVNGGYYVDRQRRDPAPRAADAENAAHLWKTTARAVGLA